MVPSDAVPVAFTVARARRALVAATLLVFSIGFVARPQSQSPIFRVVLLGTGTPAPSVDRLGPAILVEAGVEKLIFDVGRTSIPITSPDCPICG